MNPRVVHSPVRTLTPALVIRYFIHEIKGLFLSVNIVTLEVLISYNAIVLIYLSTYVYNLRKLIKIIIVGINVFFYLD